MADALLALLLPMSFGVILLLVVDVLADIPTWIQKWF